jgi:hypothetical protein
VVKRPDGRSLRGTIAVTTRAKNVRHGDCRWGGKAFLGLIGKAHAMDRVPSSTVVNVHAMQCRHCGSMALWPMNTRSFLESIGAVDSVVSLQFVALRSGGPAKSVGWRRNCDTVCGHVRNLAAACRWARSGLCYTNHARNTAQKRKCHWLRRGGHRPLQSLRRPPSLVLKGSLKKGRAKRFGVVVSQVTRISKFFSRKVFVVQ